MKVNDAVIGVALLVFAALLMTHVSVGWNWLVDSEFSGFPRTRPHQPGPALFPFILGVLLALCGAILVVKGRREGGPLGYWPEWARDPVSALRWLGIVVAIVAYQLFDELVGFLPLASVLLFLLMKQLHVSTRLSLLTALGCALVIHTFFVKFLLVPLPWGVLEPIAW